MGNGDINRLVLFFLKEHYASALQWLIPTLLLELQGNYNPLHIFARKYIIMNKCSYCTIFCHVCHALKWDGSVFFELLVKTGWVFAVAVSWQLVLQKITVVSVLHYREEWVQWALVHSSSWGDDQTPVIPITRLLQTKQCSNARF